MAERTVARWPGRSRQLAALYEAAIAFTSELSLDRVLQKIVDVSRELVGASYAALGVLGEDGQLSHFVTSGLAPSQITEIGQWPGGRGLLGVLLRSWRPLRLSDMDDHPESCGSLSNNSQLARFLGVPLINRGRIVGGLCLTDKADRAEFSAEDEALIEMLAAQAAVAVENARLFALTDEALRHKVDELQAERRKLKAIVDQMPEGVTIVDRSAENVILANRAALSLLGINGVQCEEVAGGYTGLHPVRADGSPVPREETPIYRVVTNGETVAGEQICLTRADGTRFTALANAAPLFDPEGQIIAGIVVFQDISSLKELDRLKDELISIISHELRNPLTAIRGRAQLMLRTARRMPGRQDDIIGLEAIDAQVEKLVEMVRELLDVSQMRLGLVELRRQRVDLVALVRQAVDQVRTADDHHTFCFEAPVDTVMGDWDGFRVDQVILNLLENAQKYSPRGGRIVVRVSEQMAALDSNGETGEDEGWSPLTREGADVRRWAVVAVTDEGIGIPKESQRHLFDRFYRAANAKGRAETGLGLGLYICYEIVKQHGGVIWVNSTEGSGSSFCFALPT